MPIYEDTRAVLAMLKDVQQSVIENDDLSNNPQVLKMMILIMIWIIIITWL